MYPFEVFKSHSRKNDDEPVVLELDESGDGVTGGVTVPCVCGVSLVRAAYPPHRWVHDGDEVIVQGGVVIQASAYDHEPRLNVIEATVVE